MDQDNREIVTRLAKVWRGARYDAAHEKAANVRELHYEWPDLFDALEALQREWPE